MIVNERNARHRHVMQVAQQMMTAARTAPKGKGVDIIEIVTVDGDELLTLAQLMREVAEEKGLKFLLRDANNVEQAECIMFIGTASHVQGLNCAHCGFATCEMKPLDVPCAINSVDVGIAIGSACAMAADCRVDTRVMFSAGYAAQRLGWLGECRQVYAILISASSKNPFFDRKSPVSTTN